MKYIKSILFGVVLLFLFSSQSQAQNPNSAARVAMDIWNQAEKISATPGSTAYNDTLLWFWDSKSRSSWASISPKRLDRNKNLAGTVAGKRERNFVSMPILNKNSMTITIDETGGKGKTSVTVYKISKNGRRSKVGTKWFNNTDADRKKSNEKLTFTVNGARNHIIAVHVNGKSAGESFKYKLRAN